MNIISVDIETTGLDPNRHQILSISACTLDEKEPKVFYQQIAYAEYAITPKAMQANQIDVRNWGGLEERTVASEFTIWLNNCFDNLDPIYGLGFSVGSFDLAFLKRMYEKYNMVYPFHHQAIDLDTCLLLLNIKRNTIDTESLLRNKLDTNPFLAAQVAKHKSFNNRSFCESIINGLVWKFLRKDLIC